MKYIYALFLIGIAILIHETGHFIFAKIVKLPVKSFSIGFGPALWKKKIGNTEYRISAIPLGGYVLPEIEDEESFFKLPVYQRVIMSAGGPLASLFLPVICYGVIGAVSTGLSFNSLIYQPVMETYKMFHDMLISLPMIFSDPGQLSGVVGIVAQGGEIVKTGLINGFYFLALISTNFALLNLLPIPVLDGGKIILYLLEKLHHKFYRLHYPLAIAGWLFILGLMVYVTVLDLSRHIV